MKEKQPCWTIYCHTHAKSGRRYVGLTSRSMELRWRRHVADAGRIQGRGCSYFWAAIRKYGPEAFTHEILETCETLEIANAAEQRWIEKYESRNHEKGFNFLKGGEHTPHRANNDYRSSPEYLESQRLAAEERWKDPEYRTKTLEATYSAITTTEVRKKLSGAVSELWKDPEYRKSQLASLNEASARPEVRQKLRENWDDPVFREKCSSGPRARAAAAAAATHCKRGHEFTSENVAVGRDGSRECKACNYARKKAAKTACPKGHPYDGLNVVMSSSGRRMCAVCLAESKVKPPCRVCGSLKDMLVSGRLRCRPCGNRRALESRRRTIAAAV